MLQVNEIYQSLAQFIRRGSNEKHLSFAEKRVIEKGQEMLDCILEAECETMEDLGEDK